MAQEVAIKFSLPSVEKLKKFEEYLAPLGVFLIALVVYIRTLAPSIVFGDAGELTIAAHGSGIAHPPGFPIWCIFTKLFTLLPINNVAWRASLATAFYSAVGVALTFILIKEVLGEIFPKVKRSVVPTTAFLLSLSVAFTQSLWSQSVSAEVYSLDFLFSVLIALVLFRWYQHRDNRLLILLSFLSGLSLTNHYFVGLLLPAAALFVLITDWKIVKNWKLIGLVLLAFSMGLLPYLYLPLRSRANPVIDWGNPSTWQNFINHITRKQYSGHDANIGVYVPIAKFSSLDGGLSRVFKMFWYIFEILGRELLVLVVPAVLGLVYLFKNRKKLFLLVSLLIFFRVYLFMYLLGVDSPAQRGNFPDLIFLFVVGAILAGVGIVWGWKFLHRWSNYRPVLLILCFLTLPALLIKNYSRCDLSDNRIALYHAQNVLNTVEENGTIVFAEDFFFPVMYLMLAEGQRPDITLFDRGGNIYPYAYDFPPGARDLAPTAYRALVDTLEQEIMSEAPGVVYQVTYNSCEQVRKRGVLTIWKDAPNPGPPIDLARDYANILRLNPEEVGHRTIDQVMASFYHLSLGYEHYQRGHRDDGRQEFLTAQSLVDQNNFSALNNIAHCWSVVGEEETALALLNDAARLRNNHPGMQFNLGLLNTKLGNLEEAAVNFQRVIALDSQYVPLAGKRLAGIYLKHQKWDEALEIFRLLRANDPLNNEVQLHYGHGVALFNTRNFSEALEHFEKVIAVEAEHIKSWEGRGMCYFSLGQRHEAREVFRKLLEFDPTNELAPKMLAKLELE